MLAAERDDELPVVDKLADDLFDAIDHRLRAAAVHGDLRQGVDADEVRLAINADVVQLHVAGGVDDRRGPFAGAYPAGGRGIVRHGEDDDAGAAVVALLRCQSREVRWGKEALVSHPYPSS